MKSIQIILLMCIHLGDAFPSTMSQDVIDANIAALLKKGLIVKQEGAIDDVPYSEYEETYEGREAVHQLWSIFDYDIRALK